MHALDNFKWPLLRLFVVVGVFFTLVASDDLLDRLRRKQAERKKSRMTQAKTFYRKNIKRLRFAALLASVLTVLAIVPGIGFTSTIEMTSVRLRIPGHPCHGYDCSGTMSTDFNPILYPANHLFGSEVSTTFTRTSEPYDSSGDSVKHILVMETVLLHLVLNIPLFFLVGCAVTVGLERATRRFRKRLNRLE
jgi:hypothetical protein